ncbi:MAG: SDR family NAD(P)-dependent oxidoreductase, partial [Acidobacteriaceae bacterium]|nr:SDR family NAD(P)-dependent oxidoreductase [Acidobacteriaceae bacterium]
MTGFSDADYNTLQTVGEFTRFTFEHENQTDQVIARLPGNNAGTLTAEENSFHDLLGIAKHLTAQSTGKTIKLLVVVPQTSLHRSASPLHAVARSLRLETTSLECRVLELDFSIPDWPDKLIAEAHHGAPEDFAVRYRGKERQVLVLRESSVLPTTLDPKTRSQPRTWIITGATGGLGMLAARHLAETGAANLMLTGRSQPDENLTRMMNTLRDLGAKVIYCPADLTAESDVSRLIAETRKQFGAIEGWLHAAGISRAARLPYKTTSDVTAVLGPKVTGTLLLDKELRKEPLQRIILFSSIAGVLGDFGQTDYAFANAFLDAFAEQHKSHTVSIR